MSFQFPGGAKFALTIIDDTDVSTLENVRPVYDLLKRLGLRATKTVWVFDCDDPESNFRMSDTLERPAYRDFALELQNNGFELTWHCPTMESSPRSRIFEAYESFVSTFGVRPRVHANHALNRENIYWGEHRFDDPIIRRLYRYVQGLPRDYFQGHVEGSEYWWGDLCSDRFDYVRNLTFRSLNLLHINPTLPYHDSSRPLVKWWFSSADAENCGEFNALLNPQAQDALLRQRGICIVSTHFGKDFVEDGKVNPITRMLLERLAGLPGWFPTVSELLDWLKNYSGEKTLPKREWREMQWRWAMNFVAARFKATSW